MSAIDGKATTPRPTDPPPLAGEDAESRVAAIEAVVLRVLQVGVLASVVLVVVGALLSALRLRGALIDPARLPEFVGDGAARPRTLHELASGLVALEPESLMSLGILVLIATPIARVLASMIAFIRLRDRAFTILTAAVLAALLVSFLLGRVG